jgi:death-on-curing family protein
MENLKKEPRLWLTLKMSQNIFERYKPYIDFDEPIPPFDTRFPGRLESIFGSVSATYGQKYLNPTVLDAAASYFYQLCKGHPFQNGNKRIAVLLTHIFLITHGVDFTVSDKSLYNLAMVVANLPRRWGITRAKSAIKKFFSEYTKDIPAFG